MFNDTELVMKKENIMRQFVEPNNRKTKYHNKKENIMERIVKRDKQRETIHIDLTKKETKTKDSIYYESESEKTREIKSKINNVVLIPTLVLVFALVTVMTLIRYTNLPSEVKSEIITQIATVAIVCLFILIILAPKTRGRNRTRMRLMPFEKTILDDVFGLIGNLKK